MIRSIRAYTLLVAIPLAGLGVILRQGSRLQAPPAIGGDWRVLVPVHPSTDSGLYRLRIEQSGSHVALLYPREMKGVLRGDSLIAVRTGLTGGPCPDGSDEALRARIDTTTSPLRLEGAFYLPGEISCTVERVVAELPRRPR